MSEHLAKVETITEVLQEILTQSGEQLEECQEIEMVQV